MTEHHIGLIAHQPVHLGGYNIHTAEYRHLQKDLEQYIKFALSQHDTIVGHTGMGLGADLVWANALLNMKKAYPGRVLISAEIPHDKQTERWTQDNVAIWNNVKANADTVSIYEHDIESATKGLSQDDRLQRYITALNIRTAGLIEKSDTVLAVWLKSEGITQKAVTYAESKNKNIVLVDPAIYFSTTPTISVQFLNDQFKPKSSKTYTYSNPNHKAYTVGEIYEITSNNEKSFVQIVDLTLSTNITLAKLKPLNPIRKVQL